MENLRTKCENRNIPIISSNTEIFLQKLLQNKRPKTIVELGTAVGYSTSFMAKEIQPRNGIIYSFERSYPSYLEALSNLKEQHINNAKLYPFNISHINLQDFLPEKVDFFFIDAQKSQYGNYMMKIHKLYGTAPTIVIDDVIKYKHKLSGLYEFLNKKQIKYKILQLDSDDGILLISN